ncbi:MAG TPA: efflux RND transporter permease subunit [Gammaproteobacteria bacterium]|jgi:multidrug efflux pump subunit AcrB|nr:MAG: AcrB/AcrD/AcrF family protein [Gammaproteobacteria bacterium]HBK77754.1 acriflavin resistance protein [Gammaproteobacteria bacterium]HIM98024.1 efflux RND transporter permease subunit [Gammaproteobacteria bacterium]
MSLEPRNNLLGLLAGHPVAANLMMTMMIIAGIWGLSKLNVQFFPNFDIDFVSVKVVWVGASAEDIEKLITEPLEQQLRGVDRAKELRSRSVDGLSLVTLEFKEGTDMGFAVDQVKEQVDLVRNLPATAETPEIGRIINYEPIASVLIAGPDDPRGLRSIVRRFERELLERGISNIRIFGLPEEEIAIQIPSETLRELGISLEDIGRRIGAASRDLPVGVIGRGESARQLRFKDQRRGELAFADLPVIAAEDGRLLTLGDIADIQRRPQNAQTTVTYRGRPAVEMRLSRSKDADSLKSARIMREWVEQTRPLLPTGFELNVYDERWGYIKDRINLLLKNGATGLVLVILILYLFLNVPAASWITVGIPTSFMAALGALYVYGGSINMISLFGLIMTLGIIVDDAIVVGEDAVTHFERGDSPLTSVQKGAQRMLAPVLASSLTTIAAFMPLLLVGGIIGIILRTLPVVVICVILASLIEAFLVLPGHLRGTFARVGSYRPRRLRKKLNDGFVRFRETRFRPTIVAGVRYRWLTVALAAAIFIVSIGWIAGGRIAFNFFPVAEGPIFFANVDFVAGTPKKHVADHLDKVEQALWDTNDHFGGGLVVTAISRLGLGESGDWERRRSENIGSVLVELVKPDARAVRNRTFIEEWRARIPDAPGLENLSIKEPTAGPPGQDIEVQITGPSLVAVKSAALALKNVLIDIPGVSGVEDDMPYGREQIILRLTPTGEALGLSVENLGRQLRAGYEGYLVQVMADNNDEVEVRVVLPDDERNRLDSLNEFEVMLPGGGTVPFANIVTLQTRRGFDSIRHVEGNLAITVTGDVDDAVNNDNRIIANLKQNTLPGLEQRHSVRFSFEGRQADQRETLSDMKRGAILALVLIYLVLAWVFGSYGWPLLVMAIIPFGLVGAIWGHTLMNIDLTILSMFGFFGLAGIVVNNSIILVVFYKQIRADGLDPEQAVVEAACQRLRAVLLTSLTTIAGLTPLLFETSLQAQFLIPMATSIAFGLAFATLLVLFLVPALLMIYEHSFFARRSASLEANSSS